MMANTSITGRTSREIADSLEAAVESGSLRPHDPVPSVRGLATRLGVSPSTVAAAYRDLRVRGIVVSMEGRDTRVAARPPVWTAPSSPATGGAMSAVGARDVSDGNPDRDLLPDLRAAIGRIDTSPCVYGAATVNPALAEIAHEQFADLREQLGSEIGQVAVVGGAMDGVERVLTSCTRPGDRVIVEDPGHAGILDLARAMGLESVGVGIDDDGPVPDDVRRALQTRPAAFVVTPRAQNPAGSALSAERAAVLREILAGRKEMTVVENDHASLTAGAAYVSLSVGRTNWAVVRSMSKHLGPDLRLGFLTGDRRTVGRVAGRHLLGAGWVSNLLQQLVVELWRDESMHASVRRAERRYRERREALLLRLAEHGITAHGRSGLNVMVPVPHEAPVIQQMQARGWALRAGDVHRLHSPPFVRITTATLDPAESERLATDLAAVLAPTSSSHLT
ncbi:aminotransferase class I/II-fold pyridoxal phosphate-dependent enzyme [Phytoactinopolyspora alkaliphila]|uniref:Aminotransferase class I/II-fold pyridoxal phosphate-dependent enzyme n=1 Tax=Phytoactinopolyspora alkaliphila TaxID=1783498 RepID=A0A6N9YFM2_9ACTN|nr:aminotransferase class I/II-fold pyridoxal phosphate-dependent enzyme [Phytoactinopolyspora alkaliphila]NED93774.1 aminotransferase class I/II-fold pyridoxal phosphate-dependent enzyme [Phytoactinopolyspora alkaliphila]